MKKNELYELKKRSQKRHALLSAIKSDEDTKLENSDFEELKSYVYQQITKK